ncbi:MAG: DUF3857 and transglutaminase domain-containing protein [Prevotellaceae bacterium]|jgi:hypothetical protein|nr:DUF3857 and transglutaminase domain-containing protein [Prevotellaceae bacterium]
MKKLVLFALLFVFALSSAQADNLHEQLKNTGDAAKYPGQACVVLIDSTGVNVQETGLSHFKSRKVTKILTERGALNHRIVIFDYDPLTAALEVTKAVIYRADGSTETIDLKKVNDYPAPARAIYWGARQKMVEFGQLNVGDAIEVETFKKGFTYALLCDDGISPEPQLPQVVIGGYAIDTNNDENYIPPMRGEFYDIVPFWTEYPTLKKVYCVSLPDTKEMQYEFYNGECSSSVYFDDGRKNYTFSKFDIMPFKTEPNMVDRFDVAPKLFMSTAKDWNAKSLWFYGVNEDYGSFDSTPEVQAKVNELIKSAKTEMEKVSILTHWVADNMRYSGISMGAGEGFTLHNTQMNYTDRCGVCKDKAALLISMLRCAGFESYPAMTMAGSRIEQIPADHFNHSVTVVKLSDGKYHLLDPTWVPFVRELWSSAEQQQNYLMGVPEGVGLMETPISPAENHYVRIAAKSSIDKNGTLTGEFTITAEGQSDAAVRRPFTGGFMANWKAAMERELLNVSPNARLISVDYGKEPKNYIAAPIKITMKYNIPNYALVGKNEMIFTPFVMNNLYNSAKAHLGINTSLKERNYGFKDRCSRLVELKETITLPAGYKAVQNNWKEEFTGQAADFNGYLTQNGNNIEFYNKITLKKRVYDADDWDSFRTAVEAQREFVKNPVILKN